LIGVQLAVLRFGLRPLAQLVRDLRSVEDGERERLGGDYPSEVEGVAAGLNQLLAAEAGRRRRYRDTLADLAHSLKTPLAVLRTTLDTETSVDALRTECDAQVERMNDIVTHQLGRAGASGGPVLGKRCAVAPVAERLAGAMAKIHADRHARVAVEAPPDVIVRADEPELMEMLGNLLDNACKHGGGRVGLRARREGNRVVIEVSDEGPGIAVEQRTRVLERGARADAATPGQGLGLSVTAEIARGLGGDLEVGDGTGPSGRPGARLLLSLPAG
jgi:two-component system sensor histidine kinase PhoQ